MRKRALNLLTYKSQTTFFICESTTSHFFRSHLFLSFVSPQNIFPLRLFHCGEIIPPDNPQTEKMELDMAAIAHFLLQNNKANMTQQRRRRKAENPNADRESKHDKLCVRWTHSPSSSNGEREHKKPHAECPRSMSSRYTPACQ